jgi:hypothetical protein
MVTVGKPLALPEATEMKRMLARPANVMNAAERSP